MPKRKKQPILDKAFNNQAVEDSELITFEKKERT
jgi:hypothetical protein